MINAAGIFVKYGDRVLLNKVDLSISPGESIGLVGRNGAGKSTLLKILAKENAPHAGNVAYPKEATIGFLHQDLEIPKDKTVREEAASAFKEIQDLENRLDEITKILETTTDYESESYFKLLEEMDDINTRLGLLGSSDQDAAIEKILKGLGFKQEDFDKSIGTFSGGWQMRVILAQMLLQVPDYLLLDEPTNHLDIESIVWLESYLKTYKGAIIVISHDKQFLDQVTKRTIEVEMGKIHDYKYPYSRYLVEREERMGKIEAAYENQQKLIAQREKTINRFMAKATKTKMAQSMKKQLDKIERIELDVRDDRAMKIQFQPAPRSGQVTIEGKGIIKNYGKKEVLQKIDFQIERGQRIAFVGQNGMGKSTLAKILVNEIQATGGEIIPGHNLKIGYYAQDQSEAMVGSETVLETIENQANEKTRPIVRKILGAFMFSGEDVEKKVSVLSGGERARLALACLLLEPVNLLVLDEPTNHLDIPAKNVLKEAINNYDGALIVVSHDRDFLEGLTHNILEFRNKQTFTHIGDINDFLEKRAVENMRELEKTDKKKVVVETKKEVDHDAIHSTKKKIKNLENKIEKTEKEIEKLELEMADPSFYQSADSNKKIESLKQKKADLDQYTEQWEEEVEKLESLES